MKKISGVKTFAACLATGMLLGLGLTGCSNTATTTTVSDTSVTTSTLKAGAGMAPINFPSALFTTPSAIEGFNGTVHDVPHARVMVLESNSKVAIVSLELVRTDADGVANIKQIVNQYTGTPLENIYVHSNHTITTPHEPTDSTLLGYWMSAVEAAVTTASQQAASTYQNAIAGFATGTSDVNVNRNVQMSDGKFHIGLTDTTHASNKTMTILGVKGLVTGTPIGYIISYGVKPTSVDNAGMSAGVRQISADVPGLACTMMEAQFNAPTMYLMGATADQVPKYDAYRAYDNGSGTVTDNVDDYPTLSMAQIFAKMTPLGTQMGNDAIAIAKNISYSKTNPTITFTNTTFSWPAVSYNPGGNDYSYTAGTLNVEPVFAVRFGDAAFIGTKPEIDAVTEQQLQAIGTSLGFSHVMVSSFIEGDAKYMPHSEAYGLTTGSTLYPVPSVEAKKTGFAQGAAEEFVTTGNALLNGFLGKNLVDTTGPSAISTQTTNTNGTVTITVIAYDDISGVNSITTPSGTIVQGSTTTYTVSTNGTYKFTLMDYAGNTTTYSVSVTSITV